MELADHFVMLWGAETSPPDVFSFLKAHPNVPPRECADILLIDQHHRFQSGKALPVETYLREFPAVAADPELKLDLVFSELRNAAQMRGGAPDVADYVARFPELGDELIRQFEVAEWLDSSSTASLPGPDHVSHLRPAGSGSRSNHPAASSTLSEPATANPPSRGRLEEDADGASATPAPLVARTPWSGTARENLEILEKLGEGGMGVVFRARQTALNRFVAVKMIHAGASTDSKQLARFHTEVQAVARLSHPNIVQIYEIGEWDGLPYFIMEYANGGSLERKLASGPLPLRQAAQLIETLARALAAAHEHGIVHRDLKPANILLTLDGQPKITDFGLAKIGGGPELSNSWSGAILGTPSYMAPEQAQGSGAGVASDIYSLGATLYEMLTGRPPFRGTTVYGTLVQVMNQDVVPPGRLRLKLPCDLQTICLKCLEKQPQRRYASATALAEDLHAFLSGEPIRAHAAPPWELAVRGLRRRPLKVLLMAAVAVTAVGLLLGIWASNILAVSSVAVLSLIAGGSWYQIRLLAVVRKMSDQQIVLERYAERLQMLGEMTRQLMAVTELDRLLYLLGETAARLANAELATLYLIDRERGEVRSKVMLGSDIGEIRIPLGRGIAGTVAATGQMINLPDPYADPRFNASIDRQTGYKTRNLITLPMIARNGQVIGVFQVLNKRRGTFEAEDEEVLGSLAATAAVIIERAQAQDS
jgi:serine/threonine-protein kinase